jgi:hypothetical protein
MHHLLGFSHSGHAHERRVVDGGSRVPRGLPTASPWGPQSTRKHSPEGGKIHIAKLVFINETF